MVPSTYTQRNSQRRSNTCRAHDRTLCIMTRQLSAIPCITPPVSSPPWARGRTIDNVQYPHAPPSQTLLSHCCAMDAAPLTAPRNTTLRNLRCMHTPVLAPHRRPGPGVGRLKAAGPTCTPKSPATLPLLCNRYSTSYYTSKHNFTQSQTEQYPRPGPSCPPWAAWQSHPPLGHGPMFTSIHCFFSSLVRLYSCSTHTPTQ